MDSLNLPIWLRDMPLLVRLMTWFSVELSEIGDDDGVVDDIPNVIIVIDE